MKIHGKYNEIDQIKIESKENDDNNSNEQDNVNKLEDTEYLKEVHGKDEQIKIENEEKQDCAIISNGPVSNVNHILPKCVRGKCIFKLCRRLKYTNMNLFA